MRNLADHYADALVDVALSQNAAAEVRRQLGDFPERVPFHLLSPYRLRFD